MKDLEHLPDSAQIHCQVIGTEANSGAWYMLSYLGTNKNFRNEKEPILTITHHNLLRLSPEVKFKE